MRVNRSADSSTLVVLKANGEELPRSEMTPLQRRALDRFPAEAGVGSERERA